jgi:hypothetical protein
MMSRRRGKGRAPDGLTALIASISLIALLLVAFCGVAEASWSHIEGGSEILAASSSPFSTVIKQTVGRTVSLLMLAVGIIIAVPLVIAGLAFSVSYVLSRAGRRWEKRRRPTRHSVPTDALPRTS